MQLGPLGGALPVVEKCVLAVMTIASSMLVRVDGRGEEKHKSEGSRRYIRVTNVPLPEATACPTDLFA
jgi:hypothetical protein